MARLLNRSSQLQCAHGGTVQIITTNTVVKGGSDFLVRSSDTFIIVGCSFSVVAPHPCVRIQWVQTAAMSRTAGAFNLTEQSVGLTVAADGAVQGTALIVSTQQPVSGL